MADVILNWFTNFERAQLPVNSSVTVIYDEVNFPEALVRMLEGKRERCVGKRVMHSPFDGASSLTHSPSRGSELVSSS